MKTPAAPPGFGRIHRLRQAVAWLLRLPSGPGDNDSGQPLSARDEQMISLWLFIAAMEAVNGVAPGSGAALGFSLGTGQTLREDQFIGGTHPGG